MQRVRSGTQRRLVFRAACLVAGALCALLGASPSTAGEQEELEALREEIRAERAEMAKERAALAEQRRRVDAALEELDARAAALPAVSARATPEVLVNKPPQAQLEIYGFVQADAIYDANRVDPDWSSTLRPSKIPVNCPEDAGCGNDGETILSVRQSRFGVNGLLPTPVGDVTTKFEFDLFGVGDDAGETTFRLRHAWGELGPFGGGQTSSLFMDPSVFPNTIDYWGPVGMVFLRNPQLRWTPFETEHLTAAIAVESPSSGLDQGKVEASDISDLGEDVSPWNQYPDSTAQIRWQDDWGHVQLAGILRVLGFEIRGNEGREPDGQQLAGAANLSGSFNLFEADQILWQVVGGAGFANYMNDGGVDLAPAGGLDGAKAVPGLGWLLYYNRQWSERWTSSVGFSEHRQFPTNGQTNRAFQTGQYASVNVLFHPTAHMFAGPEFIWGRRVNRDLDDGSDSRVQFSVHYDFGATLFGRR